MAAVKKVKSVGNKRVAAVDSDSKSRAAKGSSQAMPAARKTAAPADTKKRSKTGKKPRAGGAVPLAAQADRLYKDTFRMPRADFERLRALKQRARALGRATKKSELIRAGLRVLSDSQDAALLAALGPSTKS